MLEADKNVAMVVASRDFQDREYEGIKHLLEETGFGVRTFSSIPGECFGVGGHMANSDGTFGDINLVDFDAIVFIGGPGAMEFFEMPDALRAAREFYSAGKIVGAICMAPVILVNAKILGPGKRATISEGVKKSLLDAGAVFTGEDVTVDGNVLTGNGPEATEQFAEKLCEMLGA